MDKKPDKQRVFFSGNEAVAWGARGAGGLLMKKAAFITGMFIFLCAGFMIRCWAQEPGNETLKTIFGRKSVRSYTGETVPEDNLKLLARAGMAAPTAVDRRPWDFIIITDKSVLKQLAQALPYAKMAEQASSAIVVTGSLDRQFGGREALSWVFDCSAASENILLAAESMGLGAVWTGIYPDKERVSAVKKILGIPDNVVPLNLIPVGVPAGKDKPKDKFNPEQIHINTW